jgi:2-polyprenyl-3-methyl-5-hydroxy-6-metoxy-1,4-benzoquinol methylase
MARPPRIEEGEVMQTTRDGIDFPELAAESQRIWNGNARWWDARMGEGNDWHTRLIAPTVNRLLDLRSGESVADLACGNGLLARDMARQGVRVLACDFSAEFLDCARTRSSEYADRIEYRLMDLSDPQQLAALGTAQFDAAVCNMAIMDMAAITPLLAAVRRAVRAGGRFVFSILHPCFNTNGTRLIAECDDVLGVHYAVRVDRYLGLEPESGIGILGQPAPHYYFHRPLSVLLAACFAAGFVVDGFEEPSSGLLAPPSAKPLTWNNYTDIPPILAVRLR